MANNMDKIPTPLEVVDLAADIVNQVFSTPARVGARSLGAAAQAFRNLERDIAKPREHAEIPPPPGVLAEPAISGVGHIAEGVLSVVQGAVGGVGETVNGIKREIDTFVRRR